MLEISFQYLSPGVVSGSVLILVLVCGLGVSENWWLHRNCNFNLDLEPFVIPRTHEYYKQKFVAATQHIEKLDKKPMRDHPGKSQKKSSKKGAGAGGGRRRKTADPDAEAKSLFPDLSGWRLDHAVAYHKAGMVWSEPSPNSPPPCMKAGSAPVTFWMELCYTSPREACKIAFWQQHDPPKPELESTLDLSFPELSF